MTTKGIILVITIVLLAALAVGTAGCLGGGGERAGDMMKNIPKEAMGFTFTDVNMLRSDGDLDLMYDEWEPQYKDILDNFGIDVGDVDVFTYYYTNDEAAMLIEGSFDLGDVADEMDNQDYENTTYNNVEMWNKDGAWVALLENLVVAGHEDAVNDCVDVAEDGHESLCDNINLREVMDGLTSGFYIVAGDRSEVEEYPGLQAGGTSVEKKKDDILKRVVVYLFDDEDAAAAAADDIEQDFRDQEDWDNIEVKWKGLLMEASAEVNINDYLG